MTDAHARTHAGDRSGSSGGQARDHCGPLPRNFRKKHRKINSRAGGLDDGRTRQNITDRRTLRR